MDFDDPVLDYYPQEPTIPPAEQRTDTTHNNLIFLLAKAQLYGIDILPAIWQPTRDMLFANAFQPVIRQDIPLAFKSMRIFSSKHALDDRPPFHEMITEISVLSQPLVQASRNVINLEGISWNIDQSNVAWPVFVYERGSLLRDYLITRRNRLTLEEKLSLCADIGQGLAVLHDSGVVHADLKPDNIIVFQDTTQWNGNTIAKVADVSFSAMGSDEEMAILPCSPPWTAPEYDDRYWEIHKARRMDIYSFGLICFWILAWDETFSRMSILEGKKELKRLSPRDGDLHCLHVRANALVDAINIDEERSNAMKTFFHLTLAKDPQERAGSARQLLSLLAQRLDAHIGTTNDSSQEPTLRDPCHFKLSRSISQFSMVDFRVRERIFSGLKAISQRKTGPQVCPVCEKNSALQLALCYELAFGTERSKNRRDECLKIQGLNDDSLKMEIEKIRKAELPKGESSLSQYFQTGLACEYQRRNDLEEARRHLDREIVGRSACFGDAHPLVTLIQNALAHVLEAGGQILDAQRLQEAVFKNNHRNFGEQHPETLGAMCQLAFFYDNNGQFFPAIEMGEKLITLCKEYLTEDNRITMISMANLAIAYAHAKRAEDAESLQKHVNLLYEEVLGVEHPETLKCLSNLCYIYTTQPIPDMEAAAKANRRVFDRQIAVQDCHSDAFKIRSYALLDRKLLDGPNTAILTYQKQLFQDARKFLTEQDPNTWLFASHLADTLAEQGEWATAHDLFKLAKANLELLLGSNHQGTLDFMVLLGSHYYKQGLHCEAVEILSAVLDRDATNSQDVSQSSVSCLYYNALSHQELGKHAEAMQMLKKLIEASEHKWDWHFDITRSAITRLADMTIKHGVIAEGINMHKRLLDWCVDYFAPLHPQTILARADLAAAYKDLGLFHKVEELLTPLRHAFLMDPCTERELMSPMMSILASIYHKRGKLAEAIELQRQVLDRQRQSHGAEDLESVNATYSLAFFLSEDPDHFEEAISCATEACNLFQKQLGLAHSDTIKAFRLVGWILRDQGDIEGSRAMFKMELRGAYQIEGDKRGGYILQAQENLASLEKRGSGDEMETEDSILEEAFRSPTPTPPPT